MSSHHDSYVDEEEQVSLTSSHRAEQHQNQKGLTKLMGNNNSSSSSSSNHNANVGVREGMELEDEEEEIQIDSDLEDELPSGQEERNRRNDVEVPQKCSNLIVLYLLGVVLCLACEFLVLLPAFYLRLFVVGLLYFVIWLSLTSCAVHMQICPGKRTPHSHLALALYTAALAAYIGGMGGAYYYKQAWYFDRIDTAYTNVDPHVDPVTGIAYSGDVYSAIPVQPMLADVTFVDFKQSIAPKIQDSFTSFVWTTNVLDNSISVGMHKFEGDTYCASAITSTQRKSVDGINPVIFYWAVGKNCCGQIGNDIWYNCKYWGQNIPNVTAIVELSAEVLTDSQYVPFRAAVSDFMVRNGLSEKWNGASSLLVEVMTLNDHYANQRLRRIKAWVALLVTAFVWPLLLLVFFAAVWIGGKCTACCAKNPHRTS